MALYVKFDCATCENENCYGHSLKTTQKVCDGYKHTVTNADRIRSMTDEDLAKTFYTGCESRAYNDNCLVTQELIERGDLVMSDEEQDEICLKCWLGWLKIPADKEGEG